MKCLELGIFYSGFVTDNMKIYISYGFFEDHILNLELGFSENIKDLINLDPKIDEKNLSAKFNSKNSFVSYNKELHSAQKQNSGAVTLDFLFPDTWGSAGPTYNTKIGMVPDGRKDLLNDDGTYPAPADIEGFDIEKNRIPLREIFISVEMIKDVVSTSNTPTEILKGIMDRILESSNHIIDLGLSSNNYGSNNLDNS